MDADRFDRLMRDLHAGSRRRLLAGLSAAALGVLASLGDPGDADAKKCKPKGNKKFNKRLYTICHFGQTLTVNAKKHCVLRQQGATDGACPSPPSPPPPPPFCAGKNECLTMDASCAAPGGAEMCFCFVRADAGHVGESFCAGEGGAGPVADCMACPGGEVCLDFAGCGGGLGCRLPCPNPL